MSGAAAFAYNLPDKTGERHHRGMTTEEYRLLGIPQANRAGTSRYGALRPIPDVRTTGVHLEQADDSPYAGYNAAPATASRRQTGNLGRRALSKSYLAALGGLVLIATSAVGILGAIPAQSQTLVLSGYRDLGARVAAPSKVEVAGPQEAVIDATTSAAPEVQQPQPAPAQPGAYSILGPPSLSVNQIEVVLRQYGSPAAGLGQKLYDLGIKYGIDPAYALAFFVHESGCGTKGVARTSKSIGNIRWTEGYGNFEGYRSYPTWEAGMDDWYKLITDLYIGGWGLRTVDAIIPVYAPWGDNNNPPGYIASVKALVDSWRGK